MDAYFCGDASNCIILCYLSWLQLEFILYIRAIPRKCLNSQRGHLLNKNVCEPCFTVRNHSNIQVCCLKYFLRKF